MLSFSQITASFFSNSGHYIFLVFPKNNTKMNATTVTIHAKEIVLSCIQALNNEDFKTARTYAHDDMVFEGVLGTRNGAEAYFSDMEKMKLKYDVKVAFEEGDDVCLLYDLTISGKQIFGCGWYQVKEGKINALKVVFDPRPLLDQGKR
jgi:hypothetical protein